MKDLKVFNGNSTDGVINIFKEANYTSHDVVAILRKILKNKKIGHAGTLDPNATGVLPVCINKGTKISSYLMDHKKTYFAEITFGIQTDTEDIWGNIINMDNCKFDYSIFSNIVNKYKNTEIKQVPPMYSALKVNGKKLYELARKGITINRKERVVNIYDMEILRYFNNKIILKVECSKGTYIRTLIKDLCNEAGLIGTMSNLIRMESGGLNIKQSFTLAQIQYFVDNNINDFIIPIDKSLDHFKRIIIPGIYFKKIINGVRIEIIDFELEENVLVYCRDNFIGIGEIIKEDNKKLLKMKNMFYRG